MSYRVKYTFATFSFLGFAVSLIVHASTFFGVDPEAVSPMVWLLHVGIFLAFGPALYLNQQEKKEKEKDNENKTKKKKQRWTDLFPAAPRWLFAMIGVFFVYGLINFGIFMHLLNEGTPTAKDDGTFVLQDHGTLIRSITEDEFHRHRAYVTRGFSGHWMIFYLVAAAVLVSSMREQQESQLSASNDDTAINMNAE